MVFLTKRMRRVVTVEPAYLGVNLLMHLREKVLREVEGTAIGDDGFVITVTDIAEADLKHGMVDPLDGSVRYSVPFDALLFRPFKNEVLDAVVTSVSAEVGFFAEAGPLRILVSHVHMPGEMEYVPEDGSWHLPDTGIRIKTDSAVRIKIVGASMIQSVLCAIGTINEPYLGLLA